ncbi:MAG: PIG-L family deacetylase [bacterium]
MVKKILYIFIVVLSLHSRAYARTIPTTDIVLSPHFDDAALPVGGMLAKSTHNKIVITVFSGKPAVDQKTTWDTESGFSSSDSAVAARIQENDAALEYLKASYVSLDYLDMQYRTDPDTTGLQQSIEKDIEKIITEEGMEGDVHIYFPAYFGDAISHPDHVLIHNIALDMIQKKEFPNASWYMFEDMPYSYTYFKTNKTPLIEVFTSAMKGFLLQEKNIFLNKKELVDKIHSISLYPSQLEAFKANDISLQDIKTFTRRRCTQGPCEKVYKVVLK